MKWAVRSTSSVDRFMDKLDAVTADRIARKMEALFNGPYPVGYKKLRGSSIAYRLRSGDYRILYEADVKAKAITIYTVEHRKQAYRR